MELECARADVEVFPARAGVIRPPAGLFDKHSGFPRTRGGDPRINGR